MKLIQMIMKIISKLKQKKKKYKIKFNKYIYVKDYILINVC